MPTYQYACTECDHRFEQVQSFSDNALADCPECEGRLRKLFNAVGVVFKGSGFYRNDSRADSTSSAKVAANGSGDSGSGDKGSGEKGSSEKGSGETKTEKSDKGSNGAGSNGANGTGSSGANGSSGSGGSSEKRTTSAGAAKAS